MSHDINSPRISTHQITTLRHVERGTSHFTYKLLMSVLQRVAVCCSVLERVADCQIISFQSAMWTPMQRLNSFMCVAVCVAVCWSMCCSVLQRVAACCSVLESVAIFQMITFPSAMWTPMHRLDTFMCVAIYCSVVQCGAVRCSVS